MFHFSSIFFKKEVFSVILKRYLLFSMPEKDNPTPETTSEKRKEVTNSTHNALTGLLFMILTPLIGQEHVENLKQGSSNPENAKNPLLLFLNRIASIFGFGDEKKSPPDTSSVPLNSPDAIVTEVKRYAVGDGKISPEIKDFLRHNFIWPVQGQSPSSAGVTSTYHDHRDRKTGPDVHAGCDIVSTKSDKTPVIVAMHSGRVTRLKKGGVKGGPVNLVEIDHGNGYKTIYKHLAEDSILAKLNVGDSVNRGDPIGVMGNTGHVHGPSGIHLHLDLISPENIKLPAEKIWNLS